ncbi:hypothetical protein ACFL7E_01760 [Thermodesulfobacteriota bacterium]
MASLKIRTYKNGGTAPDTTISIPLKIVRLASRLVPSKTSAALLEKGIDVKLIAELVRNEEVRGTLVEIEEHKKNEKIIISVE